MRARIAYVKSDESVNVSSTGSLSSLCVWMIKSTFPQITIVAAQITPINNSLDLSESLEAQAWAKVFITTRTPAIVKKICEYSR
jgi:hypothetical protein